MIGDPTFMGWLTVSAYFVTAIACFRAMQARERDKIFWGLLFVLTAVLCVNKQLDLQSGVTAIGRCTAILQGWYEDRQAVQATFILAVSGLCFALLFVAFVYLFRSLPRVGVAFVGLGFLMTYVSLGTASLHQIDAFISARIMGAQVNWILELSGIGLILVNALIAFQRRPTRRILPDGRSEPRGA